MLYILLMDGVQPSKDTNHITDEFIINLLSENLKPSTPHLHNSDISEHLVLYGVLTPYVSSDSQQLAANLHHNRHLSTGFMNLKSEIELADH